MWKVGKENGEPTVQCSLMKSPVTYLETTARQKIQILMNEYLHTEWLAYLRGRISDKGNVFVEDISIPPHKDASGASAEAEPFHIPKDCVGVIHSHHSMGAFHSGTDQNYVDKNFPISITVSRNNDGLVYDAVSYAKTSCGQPILLKSDVKYVQPQPLFNKDKFLKRAKDNIDKGERVYIVPPYNYGAAKERIGTATPFVPLRYRIPDLGRVVTNASGRVLSQEELGDIANNSWE